MVIKPIAEIYPDWGSEDNDSELHRLICDILDGTFDERFWDVRKAQVSVQSKEHKAKRVSVQSKEHKAKRVDDVEPPKKKHKGKKGSSDGDVGNKNNVDDSGDKAVGLIKDSEELGLIVGLYDKFEAMETSINSLVGGIEDRMVAKFRENFEQFKTSIENRVSLLETELKELKTRKQYQPSPEDDNAISHQPDEEYTSLIQKQNQRLSSLKHDDIDSDFVHQESVAAADKVDKKKKKQQKKKKTAVNKEVKKVGAVQKIVIKSRDDCNKGFVIPHLIDTSDIEGDVQQPQSQQAEGSDLVDITEKVRGEDNKLLSESEETEEEKIRNAKLSATFNVLTSAIKKLDEVGVPSKRSYPPPPPYPAIGNSGLTCMRKDLVPSKAISTKTG